MKVKFLNSKEVMANIVTAEKLSVTVVGNTKTVKGAVYLKSPDVGSKTVKVTVDFEQNVTTKSVKVVSLSFSKEAKKVETQVYAFVRKYLPLVATAEDNSIAILNYKYAGFGKDL